MGHDVTIPCCSFSRFNVAQARLDSRNVNSLYRIREMKEVVHNHSLIFVLFSFAHVCCGALDNRIAPN